MPSPEELAREKIDKLLTECGWEIQNRSTINLFAPARRASAAQMAFTLMLSNLAARRSRSRRSLLPAQRYPLQKKIAFWGLKNGEFLV